MNKKKLIVIAGPTAVGKTALSIRLALHWGTEIVSADSRQVFSEMTIGTAKPSPEELALVPHHLIGSHSIYDSFDAAAYSIEALDIIHTLFKHHDMVILCGGSGLYISAVCEGLDEMPEVGEHVRKEIISQYEQKGLGWLQEQVRVNDPDIFQPWISKTHVALCARWKYFKVRATRWIS